MNKISRAKIVISRLQQKFGNTPTALKFTKDYELLIAVILSAQCTDKRVNEVTKVLFRELPTLKSFAEVELEILENLIYSTGFYRNKAKNIKNCVKEIIKHGAVPKTMEELFKLSGIGRKTANVFLSEFHNITEGIVVDTHIFRVSKRLGLARTNSAITVEKELMKILPKKDWKIYGNTIILHGRETCKARKPLCSECILSDICPKLL